MTIQASDIVIFRGQEYALLGGSNGHLFVPSQHGYRPVAASSACWRGYLSIYAVRDERLVLDSLHLNHQDGSTLASQLQHPPPLNGVEAKPSTLHAVGRWFFEHVDLPVPYTGSVHIGHDPFRSRTPEGVTLQNFRTVHELLFEAGALISHEDRTGMTPVTIRGIQKPL